MLKKNITKKFKNWELVTEKKGDSHLLNGCLGIFNCNFYFYIGGIK